MFKKGIILIIILFFLSFLNKDVHSAGEMNMIRLPKPGIKGDISLEETINQRRSLRDFLDRDLNLEEISQLLWAAQGITDKSRGFRSAPSAGALYPLEIYIIKKDGLFHYNLEEHALQILEKRDLRAGLCRAAWGQTMVRDAPIDIVICAVFRRVTSKYGERGIRYVHMEAGHCAQNIHLMAVSLGLGSVPVGAFDDAQVKTLLKLDKNIEPLYIIPIGDVP